MSFSFAKDVGTSRLRQSYDGPSSSSCACFSSDASYASACPDKVGLISVFHWLDEIVFRFHEVEIVFRFISILHKVDIKFTSFKNLRYLNFRSALLTVGR